MNYSNLALLSKCSKCSSYLCKCTDNLIIINGGRRLNSTVTNYNAIGQRIGYTIPRQPRAKAPDLKQVIDNKILLKYGYSLNNNKKQRQTSLIKLFNELSHIKIFNYLNNLKNLNKSNKKEYDKLSHDLKWIKINYIEK